MRPSTRTPASPRAPTIVTAADRTAATVPRASGPQPPGPLVLGRYRLHRPLGAGGFGAVWMARDERLQRDVAVKVLARERIVDGRFEREARAAARLSHPAIVTLYEAAVDDDGAYLVSELVRGATLSRLLEAGRLSDRDIVEIGIVLCEALAHAHAQGVVHRDVKPSNVLIPEHPGSANQVAKLTDFGIARLIGAETLTRAGDVVGTAAYMAPEQAEGGQAGAAADLYSLALVLYEALTGVNPIALGAPARRARRLGAHLPPLRRQRRDLPGELGQALDVALRPRPRDRGGLDQLRHGLVDCLPGVADRPGVIDAPWPTRTAMWPSEPSGARDPAWSEGPDGGQASPPIDAGRGAGEAVSDPPLDRPRGRWWRRGLAGGATGLSAAWLLSLLPGSPPIAPAGAGLVAALLVAALPGLGWLALLTASTGLLASQGRAGMAILVGLAGAVPVLLLPRNRLMWPLAVGAPALGAASLAGAWPALAGRAPTSWQRAGLGAVGWIWTALAGLLAGHALYADLPPRLPPAWQGSVTAVVGHVIPRLLGSGVLLPAAVWAVAALVVPSISRRSLSLQVVLASAWSAALASGTLAILRLGDEGLRISSTAVLLGAVMAWLAVVSPTLFRHRQRRSRPAENVARLA